MWVSSQNLTLESFQFYLVKTFLIDTSVFKKVGLISLTKTFNTKEIFSDNPRFLCQEKFDSPQVKGDLIFGIV